MLAVIDGWDLMAWWLILLAAALSLFYVPILAKEMWEEFKSKRPTSVVRAIKKANHQALVKSKLRKANPICTLCREAVNTEERCSDCGAEFHGECLEELSRGKCPTLGCDRPVSGNMRRVTIGGRGGGGGA